MIPPPILPPASHREILPEGIHAVNGPERFGPARLEGV